MALYIFDKIFIHNRVYLCIYTHLSWCNVEEEDKICEEDELRLLRVPLKSEHALEKILDSKRSNDATYSLEYHSQYVYIDGQEE